MFKWFRRRSYIAETMSDIQALTFMIGDHGKVLERHHGVKQAILRNFIDQTPEPVAAVSITAALLTDAIERDPDAERKHNIAETLADWVESENPRSIRKQLSEGTIDQDMLLTRLQWSLLMALDMVSDREIEADDFEYLKSEICGALLGTPQEQRIEQRLALALQD